MKLSRTLSALMGATALTFTAGSYALARQTATPIKHLVIIYGENVSFDHYFGTYPHATNPVGEPAFHAKKDTPTDIDTVENAGLLTGNPNLNPLNGDGAANPFRLDFTQAATADQNHAYTPEQQAEDNGAADLFPLYTGRGTPGGVGAFGTTGQVMGYYDGNTVTALWSYAQHFAMSDNAWSDAYGPSTPGALEAVSGQTNGMKLVLNTDGKTSFYVPDGQGGKTMIGDVDPGYDVCSSQTDTALMEGPNVGDLLSKAHISWGSFMGGFDLSMTNPNGTTGCGRTTTSTYTGVTEVDYIPHHAWFQYYKSTQNAAHTRPSSVAAIGHNDVANHEYDIHDFYDAVKAGNFPAVSYLKAPAFQDAHAGYSDPVDEQTFVVDVVNFLQQQPDWRHTAVIVAYDDSDGWYDHVFRTPTHASYNAADQLNGNAVCGTGVQPDGVKGKPVDGRCGPGVRIPFIVISKYAKKNFVSHTPISQASIVQFIEDNWLSGTRLGEGSFDAGTGSIVDMFKFAGTAADKRLLLDPRSGLQTVSVRK